MIFNSPDKYGKGLDWTGYTVHDAANVLRRYLNQLPEPIIPLEFYGRFREPLSTPSHNPPVPSAIRAYQRLISELPPLNRQLLLYILDLLAVFASKSEQNLMTASNLAAIFQPGLISHPNHDMVPGEYRLSQEVLVFLITHQDHFLLGMRGNDDHVYPDLAGPTTPSSPRRSKTVSVSRSPSNASAGADDVRKFGGVRRNVSVTSRRSGGSPVISSPGATTGMSGLSRSNTLPSRRSPAVRPAPFVSGDVSPGSNPPRTLVTASNVGRSPSIGGQMHENVTPTTPDAPPVGPGHETLNKTPPPGTGITRAVHIVDGPPVQPHPVVTPTKERRNFFSLSPEHDKPSRPTKRLQKRRIPESDSNSAESSTTSLPGASNNLPGAAPTSHATLESGPQPTQPLSPAPPRTLHTNIPLASNPNNNQAAGGNSSTTLMPAVSPTPSATSSVTSHSSTQSQSDTVNPPSSPEKKKKRRWRLSNPPVSPTLPNGSGSNGSLADRIRRASRSPPARHRAASGDAGKPGEEDSHAKVTKSVFGWLKSFDDKKHQYEREKEKEREKEREKEKRKMEKEIALQVAQFTQPKVIAARPPAPPSPSVQPPTPLSSFQDEGSHMSPIQEKQTPIATPPVDTPSEPLPTAQLQPSLKFDSEVAAKPQTSVERISIPGESLEPENRGPPEATPSVV